MVPGFQYSGKLIQPGVPPAKGETGSRSVLNSPGIVRNPLLKGVVRSKLHLDKIGFSLR